MPSARATPSSLPLGYCCAMNQALRIPIAFFYLKYDLGDAFGPGYSGLAAARLLLRKEPSPAHPYRNFFYLKYDFGDAFGPGFGLAAAW